MRFRYLVLGRPDGPGVPGETPQPTTSWALAALRLDRDDLQELWTAVQQFGAEDRKLVAASSFNPPATTTTCDTIEDLLRLRAIDRRQS